MKYKNLAELSEAFKSGELSEENYVLIVDNDHSYLTYVGSSPYYAKSDSAQHVEYMQDKDKETAELFSGGGPNDFHEACQALGIPTDSA